MAKRGTVWPERYPVCFRSDEKEAYPPESHRPRDAEARHPRSAHCRGPPARPFRPPWRRFGGGYVSSDDELRDRPPDCGARAEGREAGGVWKGADEGTVRTTDG